MTDYKRTIGTLGIIASLTLAGCGGGGGGPSEPRLNVPVGDNTTDEPSLSVTEQQQLEFCESSDTAFRVTEVVPAHGSADAAFNTRVRVTFNAIIDPASVQGNAGIFHNGNSPVLLEGGGPSVIGQSIILEPRADLAANTLFSVEGTGALQADCPQPHVKSLDDPFEFEFTTSDQPDLVGPTITAFSPVSGEALAATDASILVEFNEAIDPASVTTSNFVVRQLDASGNRLGTVSGSLVPVGTSIEFVPDGTLNSQTFYEVSVGSGITDLAGNGLESSGSVTFRTGGLVLALNSGIVSQVPGLGDGVNALGGALLQPLAFGDTSDGLSSLDNALLLQVPLIEGLTGSGSGMLDFDSTTAQSVNGVEFTEFNSAAVAICDPATTVTPGQVNCTLGLDLGLSAPQLQGLADAFTGGNPEQVPALLQQLLAGLAEGDFSALPPELGDLLTASGDDFGANLSLIDDEGLPLPDDVQTGLQMVLSAAAQIPTLGMLFNQDDLKPLVDARLLQGELVQVDLGDLASAGVLAGTQTLIGEQGILNLGGTLFDTLLQFQPEEPFLPSPGDGLPFGPEDVPLLGDLFTTLELGNLFDNGAAGLSESFRQSLGDLLSMDAAPSPEQIPIIGTLITALDPDGFDPSALPIIGELANILDPASFDPDALPIINELASTLNPESIELSDIPVLDDLLDQLIMLPELAEGAAPEDLPLVGDLLALFESVTEGTSTADNPLTDLLNPETLTENLSRLPVVGDLLGLFT